MKVIYLKLLNADNHTLKKGAFALSANDKESAFFKEASNDIYERLPFDKKVKLAVELMEEKASETDDHKERFFRLLHFLDVNYVKPIGWARYVIETTKRMLPDTKIILNDQTPLLSVYEALEESEIEELFNSFLEKSQLKQEYLAYTAKQQGKRYFE